jgi:peptide/nickel transport system permease protein
MRSLSGVIAQRTAFGLLTLAAISILIFFGTLLLPGDVAHAILGHQATPDALAALNRELHLDRPAAVRFFNWLNDLVHGDLGKSLANGIPVTDLIGERLQNTLVLAGFAALVAIPFSLTLGIVAVIYRGGFFDRIISWSTLSFISFPDFFVGYAFIYLFSVTLHVVPNLSNVYAGMPLREHFLAMLLPCSTLVLIVSAHMIRMTRVAIINVLGSPFIEMARLKGVSSLRVVGVHALANAISPIVTVIVVNIAYLVVGVVVIEVVFVYPGIGQLMVDSVSKRDIPVVQACALIFGATYILLNMLADILAMFANPRVRYPK